MNKAFAALLSLLTSAAFVFPIFGDAAQSKAWCEGAGYSVVRPDIHGAPQTLVFQKDARNGYCGVLKQYQSTYPNA